MGDGPFSRRDGNVPHNRGCGELLILAALVLAAVVGWLL